MAARRRKKKATKKAKVKSSAEELETVEGEVLSPEADIDLLDVDVEPPQADSGTALVPADPLRRYLMEVKRFPVLTREEEHDLAVRYKESGDPDAAYQLITSNLRQVVRIARLYNRIYQNLMDLIQEGNIGLMEAVKRFDPFRGTRLPTYAAWWIKAYVLRFILDNIKMVRVGTTNVRRRLLVNLAKEKRKLESMGIVPTTEALAKRLNAPEDDVRAVDQSMGSGDLSLDMPAGDAEDGVHHIDLLRDAEQSIDEQIADGQFQEIINRKFQEFAATLRERDRAILQDRLLAQEPQTLQQIADRYGVTREAIRVAEKKLIENLKDYMQDSVEGLSTFVSTAAVGTSDTGPKPGQRLLSQKATATKKGAGS